MSLIKRLEEINVDKKCNKPEEKEADPYFELKTKIQNIYYIIHIIIYVMAFINA